MVWLFVPRRESISKDDYFRVFDVLVAKTALMNGSVVDVNSRIESLELKRQNPRAVNQKCLTWLLPLCAAGRREVLPMAPL